MNIYTNDSNPSDLLNDTKVKKFIDSLKKEYDFIIINTAPLLEALESITLAKVADWVVLVAKHLQTREKKLLKSKKQLELVQAHPIGSVLIDI